MISKRGGKGGKSLVSFDWARPSCVYTSVLLFPILQGSRGEKHMFRQGKRREGWEFMGHHDWDGKNTRPGRKRRPSAEVNWVYLVGDLGQQQTS